MSKRSATEILTQEGRPYAKVSGSGSRRETIFHNEMGEFEDAWEDEIEEEHAVDAEEEEKDSMYPS